jgi:hypothetical protein
MEKVIEERIGNSRIISKNTKPQTRILIGVPMTGVLRSEWVMARYGSIKPCNWSEAIFHQFLDQYSPINFMVADARNIIVSAAVEKEFEWLLFIDHDVVIPLDFFVAINEYMIEGKTPIVGGLYFTKSVPAEPLIYRGRGNGYFAKWKLGDKVWVDGLGMGSTLIHGSILKTLYDESEEYRIGNTKARRVFETPSRVFYNPETESFNTQVGTEDLEFCWRIKENKIFEKAGWGKYEKKKYPFLVDTNLFSWHIDWDGIKYPARGEHLKFTRKENDKK